jgi:hypothetical protein
MQLVKNNFAALIDYWAVDWNYDGVTFKSQWQDFRDNGKRTRVVPTMAEAELPTVQDHWFLHKFGRGAAV